MANLWQRIREWIDGDVAEHQLENMMINAKPGSPSMQFIVRVVDAIKSDLVSGTYIPSTDNAPAYFPPIYYVFLSESDIRTWTGERLEHFQSRVAEGVMRKMTELDKKKTAQTVQIEVKPDANLNPGQIRVQSFGDSSKTDDGKLSAERPTVQDTSVNKPVLYKIEIHVNGTLIRTESVVHREIYVGRGETANIQLSGDDRIGRLHASIIFDDSEVSVSSVNENPMLVDGVLLLKGQRSSLHDGAKIEIYHFTLICRI